MFYITNCKIILFLQAPYFTLPTSTIIYHTQLYSIIYPYSTTTMSTILLCFNIRIYVIHDHVNI